MKRKSWMPRITGLSQGKSTRSRPDITALTPGSASALSKLIDLMRACGCGLRSTLPNSIPGCEKSAPKAARPVTFSRPSGLMVRLPIHLLSVDPFAVMACSSMVVCSCLAPKAHRRTGWRRAKRRLSYKEAGGSQLRKGAQRRRHGHAAASPGLARRPLATAKMRSRQGNTRLGRRRGEDRAGPRTVLGHLLFQGLDRGELGVGAHEIDKLDLNLAAVEVAREIKQEQFQHWITVVEGGPGAKVSRGVIAAFVEVDAHRVDAMAKRDIARQLEVGGRKAEAAAAAGPAHDRAGDAPEVTHHVSRTTDVALRQLGPDGGRGKHFAGATDLRHDADAEAVLGTGPAQAVGIAGALAAEAKIIADHDVAHAEPGQQHPLDEGIGSKRSKGRIEGQHEGDIDAEALQQGELARQRGEFEVRLVRLKVFARMRLEDQRRGRRLELTSQRLHLAQQRLMAAVHAIEIADRQHRAGGGGWNVLVVGKNLHGFGTAQLCGAPPSAPTTSRASHRCADGRAAKTLRGGRARCWRRGPALANAR